MFTSQDVANLRTVANVIRIKRRSVDSGWKPNWADDLADRLQAWLDSQRKDAA